MLGAREVFEPPFAEVAQANSRGQSLRRQRAGRLREEHLPTMPCRHQSLCAAERRVALVLAVARLGLAAMDAHTRPNRTGLAPCFGVKRLLRVGSGTHRLWCMG